MLSFMKDRHSFQTDIAVLVIILVRYFELWLNEKK
jgi:hypothetical protein